MRSNNHVEQLRFDQQQPVGKEKRLIDKLHDLVEYDVIEVFGHSGSGKSKFALAVAHDARDAGINFLFIDTERNLTIDEFKSLAGSYKLVQDIQRLDRVLNAIPKVKLLILDSIGYPILKHWVRLPLKEKLQALQLMINWVSQIKDWCMTNKAIAIVTNQPESIFAQQQAGREYPEPFGDKSIYACKEVIYLERAKAEGEITRIKALAYRSRRYPPLFHLFDLQISKDVKLSWRI